jgi:CubicO group peptidase (beta-lactamase class C family)
MLDWTSEEAGSYWHDWKREPLIEAGLVGHWTDLGEPEIFDADAWYQGIEDGREVLHTHLDIHNLYNFLWSKSIYDGYVRNEHIERPFILSRSGAPGIQRFGTGIWSGDISGLLSSLATHFNAQMHMSMSGMDYFSADIGGFWRQDIDPTEMYTQWFAYGMLFDVPGRPHTFNVTNWTETAPDRIGDLESNLDNVRLRYALSPYLYSLAHRAYLHAEPVFPPLVYYFQDDPVVREIGGEKLIGRDLLVGVTANPGEMEREIYLPEGSWVDFHKGDWIESSGAWYGPFLEYPGGNFQLPIFARAGSIIPMMVVDDQTMNIMGKRRDSSERDELIIRVYADLEPSSFTLYEDDGVSIAYQQGEVRTTKISQEMQGHQVNVNIASAVGTYSGAVDSRDNLIELNVVISNLPTTVSLNDSDLPHFTKEADFQKAASGWMVVENNVVIAKSGEMQVSDDKEFLFNFAEETMEPVIPDPLPVFWPTKNWGIVEPEQAGMESNLLADMLDYIQRENLFLHNLLITRRGYIVLDAPISRLTSGRPSDQISASRGVIATLVGIALDQGLLEGIDQPVLDFFTGREIEKRDSEKEAMTIEDLLTMRSGLDCVDPETELQMKDSTDWVQFALDLPMKKPPGVEVAECNLVSHLLSAILQEATGETAYNFAKKNLFEPMGITDVSWSMDPNGMSLGWQGLHMSPADSAKLGVLYLNGGNWDGNQLVSNDWVTASTIQHASTEESGIGYLWKVDASGVYVAIEEKGQWIAVIPELDVVVVLTSGQLQREPFTIKVLFRSFIEEAASPGLLPTNPEAYARLQDRLSTVNKAPEPQAVPPLPETAIRISGKTYLMEEGNQLGWREITFSFPGGSGASLSLLAEDVTAVLPIGLDGIFRVPSEESGFPDDALIGVRGWWETEQAFQFVYKYLLLTEQGELRFVFVEDQVEVQVITPEGPITLAIGRLVE